MKKGFTLMEVLAVVLILAVIAAFAVPAVRSARTDMKNRQANAAFVQFSQAIAQLNANTGSFIAPESSFNPATPAGKAVLYNNNCQEGTATGVPVTRRDANNDPLAISNLFACGYLNPKDFKGLNYEFVVDECTPLSCRALLYGVDTKMENKIYAWDKPDWNKPVVIEQAAK